LSICLPPCFLAQYFCNCSAYHYHTATCRFLSAPYATAQREYLHSPLRMKPREAPINRWKSGSQGFGRSWHAGAMAPPPRRKTGGDEDAFACVLHTIMRKRYNSSLYHWLPPLPLTDALLSFSLIIPLLRYGISGADAVASPVSQRDDSDRTDPDISGEFSDADQDGGVDAFDVPRNLHSAPALRRTLASPMRFSFPDESFENSPSVQRPVQTTVRIRSSETVVTGGVNVEQYTL
jgi:hypothetical protein